MQDTLPSAREIKDYRLPARWAPIVMPLILSICMSFIVSGIATLRAVGLVDHFLALWMSAWGVSWLVAFPTLLLVLPMVRRLVSFLVRPQ
jgi:hypothetical protein